MYDNGYDGYEPTSEDLQDWTNHLKMMEWEDCLTIDNYYGPEEEEDTEEEEDPGSMDGDHESALASIGWGTDEDYGYYGDGDEC